MTRIGPALAGLLIAAATTALAEQPDLDSLQWVARPLVVFADTPEDPKFVQQMAMLEAAYWNAVRAEDPSSPGGNVGSMFNPRARDLLQRRVFGG